MEKCVAGHGGREGMSGERGGSRRSLSGRIASKRKERGSVGLKAKSGVEKRIRGMKREGDRAERKASEHCQRGLGWRSRGLLSERRDLQGSGHIMKACLSSHSNGAWKNSSP